MKKSDLAAIFALLSAGCGTGGGKEVIDLTAIRGWPAGVRVAASAF